MNNQDFHNCPSYRRYRKHILTDKTPRAIVIGEDPNICELAATDNPEYFHITLNGMSFHVDTISLDKIVADYIALGSSPRPR